jgi:hypothetical protein
MQNMPLNVRINMPFDLAICAGVACSNAILFIVE